jgi:hypothetical protein
MSASEPSTEALQTFKARAEWKYWATTPSELAAVAQLAIDLVRRTAHDTSFAASASAPAFDARFVSPDQIRHGLKPDDLPEITAIEIEVDQIDLEPGPHRIALTIRRPRRGSSQGGVTEPVVKLSVTGRDRDWVDLAHLRMVERIAKGARSTAKVQTALLGSTLLTLCLALGIILPWGDEAKGMNAAEVAASVLGIVSVALLLLFASLNTITPQLELLPEEGATRLNRMKHRFNFSARWLGDTVLKAAIGAVIVLAVQRLLS